jgi:predicted acyltransferase
MTAYGGRGPVLNAVLWTETVAAFIFVALRVWTRKYVLNSLGWDDLCLVATWVRIYHSLF